MAEEDKCTYAGLIANMTQACMYAKENCGEEFEVINMYTLRYCYLPTSVVGSILFWMAAAVITVSAFYLLGNLASTYLTPVLTKVSKALGLSETVSGVTLLAFANGAPDVISSFAASKAEGGLYITIGNLYGAGLFCSTLVIARCIQVSMKQVKMEKAPWSRDLIFYILANLLLVVYGLISYISIWMALVFVLIYLVYIAIVIYQDKNSPESNRETIESDMRNEHDKEKLENKMNKYMHNAPKDDLLTASMLDQGDNKARKLTLTQAEVKHIYQHEYDQAKEEMHDAGEESIADKVVNWITLPLRIIPFLTIPNLEKEDVEKPYSPIFCLTASLVSIALIDKFDFEFKIFSVNAYILAGSIGLVATICAFLLKSRGNTLFEWVLVPFALVATILWLKAAAGSVVDLITYTSEAHNINKVLLGATFLGIGNTLADFFANSSLAALGYGVMACTGSIAGQLFNLLAGITINVINSVRSKSIKRVEFDLVDLTKDKQTKVFASMIIWMLTFQLVFLFYISISTKFILTQRLAKINVIIYIACYLTFFVAYLVIGS